MTVLIRLELDLFCTPGSSLLDYYERRPFIVYSSTFNVWTDLLVYSKQVLSLVICINRKIQEVSFQIAIDAANGGSVVIYN